MRAGWIEDNSQWFDINTPAALRVHAAAFLQVLLTPPGVPENVRSSIKGPALGEKLRRLLKSGVSEPEAMAVCNLNNILQEVN